MKPSAVVLGVPLDPVTMPQAVDRIGELIASGRRHRCIHQVSTVNVDFIVNALEDPAILAVLQDNSLNLADGAPVVWASRWLGTPLPARVAGADLVPALAEASAERGWRIHLFGGAEGVAERSRDLLVERYPGASISAEMGPRVGADGRVDDHVVESIARRDVDVLCVALGNPKQERFIATHGADLGCPVQIGIGGSLDMLLGVRRRAPEWIQDLGVEWVYRAAQEPGRLGRRYAHDLKVFLPHIVRYVRAVRASGDDGRLGVAVVGGRARVVEMYAVDAERTWNDLVPTDLDVVEIDLGGERSFDPVSHGRLIRLIRSSAREGVEIVLSAVSPAADRTLSAAGTRDLVERAVERRDPGHNV
jgi:N-acetylglucosaminyldiphosphoundecaprenol N-acetyl-beta-D-mannosaminyltransferase